MSNLIWIVLFLLGSYLLSQFQKRESQKKRHVSRPVQRPLEQPHPTRGPVLVEEPEFPEPSLWEQLERDLEESFPTPQPIPETGPRRAEPEHVPPPEKPQAVRPVSPGSVVEKRKTSHGLTVSLSPKKFRQAILYSEIIAPCRAKRPFKAGQWIARV